MNLPKISVVMPSFNQAPYLEAALRSVLDQDYPNLQIVVVDGGSTDGSVAVLQSLAPELDEWISEPDRGQSDALNKGFARIDGDLVCWLNSDDTLQPGALHEVARTFEDPGVQIAMCRQFGFIDETGKRYAHKENSFRDHRTLVRFWATNGMTVNQPSVFFRRALIADQDPVLDESLHYAMDYDLWLRLSAEHPIHVVDGHWANYRFHDASKSGLGFEDFYPEWFAVSRRYWGDRFSARWWGFKLDYLFQRYVRGLPSAVLRRLGLRKTA